MTSSTQWRITGLKCVTPTEVTIAIVQAIADATRSEPDDVVLKEWRHHALTCTMVLEVLTSTDQLLARSLSIREKVTADFAALSRTPFQRVYEIWHFQQRREEQNGGPMTSKKLADDFNAIVKVAKSSEPVLPDYVTACVVVFEKGFKYPEVQEAVA